MTTPSASEAALKSALRTAALARRGGLHANCGDAPDGLRRVLAHWLRDTALAGRRVAGYFPMGSEIDPLPALVWFAGAGAEICLPQTPARGQPLIFRSWQPGEALVAGPFGTSHPLGRPITPDIVLVPLLAFDRQGRRLGYGAGYYDLTLRLLPSAQAIGCAFAGQEVAQVPVEPHDVTLRWIATDQAMVTAAQGIL